MHNEFGVKVKHGPASREGRCKFKPHRPTASPKKSPEIMSLVCIIGETHGCCSWNYVYLGFSAADYQPVLRGSQCLGQHL